MKIDFTQPIENKDGAPIKVPKRDEDGEIITGEEGPETRPVTIGEQISDFLESGLSLTNNRAEGSALLKILGDIETQEDEYTERSVEIILDFVDRVLENIDGSTGKDPTVMRNIYTFLDALEERVEEDEEGEPE